MVALTGDIGAAIRAAVIVEQSDSAIKARWPGARDTLASPAEGFFDSASDAATVLSARFALIGAFRQRYGIDVDDLIIVDPATGLPTHRLIDTEQQVDDALLLARIEVDLETETTSMEEFG